MPVDRVRLTSDAYYRTEASIQTPGLHHIEVRCIDLGSGALDGMVLLGPDDLDGLAAFARKHGWNVGLDPDLLEALEAALAWDRGRRSPKKAPWATQAAQAVAKARGVPL